MKNRSLSALSLSLLFMLPSAAIGCGSEEGGDGGAGTGGMAGTAGSTAGTLSAGGTAGTTGGSAGTGGTAGTTGGSAGTGGTAGGDAGSSGTAGTAGSAGSAGTGSGNQFPTDSSTAGIEAFLAAQSYKGEGWQAETTAPREGTSLHDSVQVYFNDIITASLTANNGPSPLGNGMPHTEGSMVVKELYTGDAMVGVAVILRASNYVFYCKSSEAGRCSMTSMPDTVATNCACHTNGIVITEWPQ